VSDDAHSPRDLDLVVCGPSNASRQQKLAYPTVHIEHLPSRRAKWSGVNERKVTIHSTLTFTVIIKK
jgi:hypothetical protein